MSDISRLQLDVPEAIIKLIAQAPGKAPQERCIQGKFLRGPVPLDWLQQAARLPGRALHVGVVLWYLDGFQQTRTVKAKPGVLQDFGADRHASYRALRALEKAGLVSVVRKKGAAPVVTLVVE
jgi:hypothetical protein